MQRIGALKPTPTGVLELAGLPKSFFDLAYFFLILEEEAGGFAVARDLGGKGQIPNVFERRFEPVEVVSAELETPKVILGVPWALPLIMVRDRVQWSSVLRVVPRDDADNMRVRPHDHPGVPCWNAPPPIISDDAGDIVSPAIKIET